MATKLRFIADATKTAFGRLESNIDSHYQAQKEQIESDATSMMQSFNAQFHSMLADVEETADRLDGDLDTLEQNRKAEIAGLLGVSGDDVTSVIGLVEFANREDASAESYLSTEKSSALQDVQTYKNTVVGNISEFNI